MQVYFKIYEKKIILVGVEGFEPTSSTTATNIQDISLARYTPMCKFSFDAMWGH